MVLIWTHTKKGISLFSAFILTVTLHVSCALSFVSIQEHKKWENMKEVERRLRHIIDYLDCCTEDMMPPFEREVSALGSAPSPARQGGEMQGSGEGSSRMLTHEGTCSTTMIPTTTSIRPQTMSAQRLPTPATPFATSATGSGSQQPETPVRFVSLITSTKEQSEKNAEDIQVLRAELDTLKGELSSERDERKKSEQAFQAEIDTHKRLLQEQQEENEQLARQHSLERIRSSRFRQQYVIENDQLKQRCDALQQCCDALQQRCDALEQRCDALEQQQASAQQQPPSQQRTPVQKWCDKALSVMGIPSPLGRAPDCKTQATTPFACYGNGSSCSYANQNVTLNAYIMHLKRRHNKNIRDPNMSEQERDRYLPI